MMEHLTHDQIDMAQWDLAIGAAKNSGWYGTSTALQAAAPGWEALRDTRTGTLFPLVWRRKFGIRYLHQPFMLQHAGPFNGRGDSTGEILRSIPADFRYVDICLDLAVPPEVSGFRFEQRINHVLALEGAGSKLRAGFSVNHRRNVRKAARSGVRIRSARPQEVGPFIVGSPQFAKWRAGGRARAGMERILDYTGRDGSGFGRMAMLDGRPVAAGWFVQYQDRMIFLKGVALQEGRTVGAMHLLLDSVMHEMAQTCAVFDFAGGNDPELARFYSGFGARQVLYLRALMNRLPPLIRHMKT